MTISYNNSNNNTNSTNLVNKLDTHKYLIPYKLHNALFTNSNKHLITNEKSSNIEKNTDEGVYLVSFRRLNKNSDILIYNYIKYPESFINSLIFYLLVRGFHINHKEFSDKRHYFVVIDNVLLQGDNFYIKSKNDSLGINIAHLFKDIQSYLDNVNNITNINVLLELLTHLLYISNKEDLSYIVDKSVKKEFDTILKFIFNGYYLASKLYLHRDDNIINNTLYVVSDLGSLINDLCNKDFKVNEGPQKWRGQINSINSFLNLLDYDYRESLYNHYTYHKSTGLLDPNLYPPLKVKSFTFNTIHQNVGNVRWFSKYSKNRSYVSSKNINKKLYHTTSKLHDRNGLFEENYQLLKNIIDNGVSMDKYKLQLKIEEMLHNQETLFTNNNIINSRLNFSTEGYDYIDSKSVEISKLLDVPYIENKRVSFSNELQPWCDKILKHLGNKNIVDLTLSYFLVILTKENITVDEIITPGIPTLTAYTNFGKKLFNKYIYSLYKKHTKDNPNMGLTLNQFITLNNEFSIMNDDTFYTRIGGNFLYNLCLVNMLVEDLDQSVNDKKENMLYLRIHPECRKIFIKNKVKIFHLPMKLPMVCPPKPHKYSKDLMKNVRGGYLLNDVLFTNPVINIPRKYGTPTELSDIVIDEINGLSAIPYTINKEALEYVILYGIEKKILTDPSDKEFIKFINNPYKSFNKRESKKYRSEMSTYLMEKNILNIAMIYSNVDKIYFPTRLDFRTRVYCDTDYFDYQKNDLARGLILFAEPGKIYKHDVTAINYFKAFGANVFDDNLDKKSLNYRVKWIDNNSNYILNFINNDIVDKAENKVSFVAFCYEYKRFIEFMKDDNKSVFYTYLPIRLDARCNCYQHLALLTKENMVYDKLNLAKCTFDEDPNDFYSHILDCSSKYIDNKIQRMQSQNTLSDKEQQTLNSYLLLKEIPFDRSIVKKTIMTKSYNAGIPTQIDLIVKNLDEQFEGNNKFYTYKNSDIKFKRFDIAVFVSVLRNCIELETPRIKELSKYLNSIAMICTTLNMPIPWKLPHGAEIYGSYLVPEERTIKAFSFVKSRYTFKKYLKDAYDLKQQKRSLAPNLIHSLDATTIALLYQDFQKVGSLYTIHDCFAVTADNVDKLISKLRIVYTKLYSDAGYLIQFDNAVRNTINNTHGDKVFELDSDHINWYNKEKKKMVTIPYPNVNNVINLDINNIHLNNALQSKNLLI